MNELSIIIPVFNEEKNLPFLYQRLKIVIKKITKKYEIIFIDDGSSDNSPKWIRKTARKDKLVKLISFSRNFGHMSAIMAGIRSSSGKRIVIMDADLQDPPEFIYDLYLKSKEGFDVVYGIKQKRKEGIIRRFFFLTYYRILDKVSSYKMPLDSGTFSIFDKKVAEVLSSLGETNKYFSGLRAWAGFKQTGILYERDQRFAGKPASFKRLFKLGMDGLFSFSYLPLRIASILGFIFASFAFFLIIVVFVLRILLGWGLIGWASTMTAILLIGGVQLITLGIIGEYLGRIYDQVKSRPEYIIRDRVNLK